MAFSAILRKVTKYFVVRAKGCPKPERYGYGCRKHREGYRLHKGGDRGSL